MPGCAGGGFLKRPQLWRGIHDDGLCSDVSILWSGCRGLALGWSSHGRDSEFLGPARKWDRAAGHPRDDAAHHPGALTDQMHHGDSHARGG